MGTISRTWKLILEDIGIKDDGSLIFEEVPCFKRCKPKKGDKVQWRYMTKNGKKVLEDYCKGLEHLIRPSWDDMVRVTSGNRTGIFGPIGCALRSWSWPVGTWVETQLRMLALDMYADELYYGIKFQAGLAK